MGLHFLVDEEGAGLSGVEVFSHNLRGAPKSGGGAGRQGRGNSSADGRVKGVRVESGEPAADSTSLGFEVFASPKDVLEIAQGVSTVVARNGDPIVQFGKLHFVVSAAGAGGIKIRAVFNR